MKKLLKGLLVLTFLLLLMVRMIDVSLNAFAYFPIRVGHLCVPHPLFPVKQAKTINQNIITFRRFRSRARIVIISCRKGMQEEIAREKKRIASGHPSIPNSSFLPSKSSPYGYQTLHWSEDHAVASVGYRVYALDAGAIMEYSGPPEGLNLFYEMLALTTYEFIDAKGKKGQKTIGEKGQP